MILASSSSITRARELSTVAPKAAKTLFSASRGSSFFRLSPRSICRKPNALVLLWSLVLAAATRCTLPNRGKTYSRFQVSPSSVCLANSKIHSGFPSPTLAKTSFPISSFALNLGSLVAAFSFSNRSPRAPFGTIQYPGPSARLSGNSMEIIAPT